MRVYKYVIDRKKNTVDLPCKVKILHVGIQRGEICVWAEVDTDREFQIWTRRFSIVQTGSQIPNGVYVGTVQEGDYQFVYHVYDCGWL